MEQWEIFEGGQRRAPRFTLELPLRYRQQGGDTWEDGSMRNISRSGLLFSAQRAHPVDTRMELTFALPKVIHDEPPATVRCQGRVIRSVLTVAEATQPAIAIKILDYQFMRTALPPLVGGT